MAQLTRKRVILIEAESSYGTDPNPSGTDVVLVTDLSITPQSSDVVNSIIDLKGQNDIYRSITDKLRYSENPNIFELKTKIAEKIISENRYCF